MNFKTITRVVHRTEIRCGLLVVALGACTGSMGAPPSLPASGSGVPSVGPMQGPATPSGPVASGGGATPPVSGELPKAPTGVVGMPVGTNPPVVDQAGPPATPPPGMPEGCMPGAVSYSKPCTTEPDPCGLNSGFVGDNYCLKPPPAGEGIQIHFGPKNYADPGDYVLQPGEEFNNSVLALVPLTESKFWDHVTVQMRPGSHHWISMDGQGETREGVYKDTTGCGTNRLFGAGGFGGGQNLIYDNPPLGMQAPENVGIGRSIAPGSVCLGLHVYNLTDQPTIREMWVNLYFVDRAKVTQMTGAISMVGALGLRVPAGANKTLTYSGGFSGAGRIIQMYGHRHKWTPRFAVWLDEELIYDSHSWQESVTFNYDSLTTNPPIDMVHDGAKSGIVAFKAGSQLKFSCFIENKSDELLTFKNDIDGGEMCNLWGTTVGGSVSGSFQ